MDTADWPLLLTDTGSMRGLSAGLPPLPLLSSAADPVNGGVADHHFHCEAHATVRENRSSDVVKQTPTSPLVRLGNRSRTNYSSGVKSEVRKSWSGGGEAKLEVVFQVLNDAKKGIPDDGHRGWKKYGNKTIQNSNHCRGYYKCSAKECRAKKMVQPTDKDPTLLEVTYVGKHTCSSTAPRRKSPVSPSTLACVVPPAAPVVEVPVLAEQQYKRELEAEGPVLTADRKYTRECITIAGMEKRYCCSSMIEPNHKRERRSAVGDDGDKASLDSFSYLAHTMTASIIASTTTAAAAAGVAAEEQVIGDSASALDTDRLGQYPIASSHGDHFPAAIVDSFPEALLWHDDFDMDAGS